MVMMMKISKCKKELASIISEHGGWRNGEFAAQDGDGGVGGYGENPVWSLLDKCWRNEAFGEWFVANKIENHHQTVLSRAEYFHLYPARDADGWIEWKGGECPVDVDALVCCKLRSGKVSITAYHAGLLSWRHNGNAADIIAYRPHKTQKSEPQYCESVTRSIPEPTAAPTIDQLLQDWRNADDFAKRKQAEADEAAAMRDERWQAVQDRAGELNVTVGRCDGMVDEQELVITDWRNLLVGDIVEIVGSENERWLRFKGVELLVSRTGASECGIVFRSHEGDEWCHGGNTNWRFIRRP